MCIKIIQEPYIYFSEADIQQLLAEELRKITHEKAKKLCPTNIKRGKGAKNKYNTSLLHREYGGGDKTRIDIVVFDPADVSKINDVNLRETKTTYLKPAYAFELGTEKTTNIFKHVQNDLNKLRRRTKETGYLIHFYKDSTLARTGTETRKKTERKIFKQFKRVFENMSKYRKVKVLAILLRTYRNQKNFRGKCEIFNGKIWAKVDVSKNKKLQKAVLKQLRNKKE